MNIVPPPDDLVFLPPHRFYKTELWTKDNLRIERELYNGPSVDKAREVFEEYRRKRPRARLTVRQGIRVLLKHNAD
jgi:hypothetical protein